MGEPGTKEVLNLADLEASGGIHTGRKHILSILVENKPGVLARIAGLFARRGFNIGTLAVGPTDDPTLSRTWWPEKPERDADKRPNATAWTVARPDGRGGVAWEQPATSHAHGRWMLCEG